MLRGAVRASVSAANTFEEVERFLRTAREIWLTPRRGVDNARGISYTGTVDTERRRGLCAAMERFFRAPCAARAEERLRAQAPRGNLAAGARVRRLFACRAGRAGGCDGGCLCEGEALSGAARPGIFRRFSEFMRGSARKYAGGVLAVCATVAVSFLTPLLIGGTVDAVHRRRAGRRGRAGQSAGRSRGVVRRARRRGVSGVERLDDGAAAGGAEPAGRRVSIPARAAGRRRRARTSPSGCAPGCTRICRKWTTATTRGLKLAT